MFWKKGKSLSAFNKSHLPDSIKNYGKLFFESNNWLTLNGRDEKIRYVVFDTESTGLNIQKDRLLSIGAVSIIGNTIQLDHPYYQVIKYYSNEFDKDTISIHGIMPSEAKSGSELLNVINSFLDFIGNSILVAHHADFDIGIINQYLEKNFSIQLLNFRIDTAKLARKIQTTFHQEGDLSLDTLCQEYKISTEGRHNSLGDAAITAELFLKLTAKLIRMGKKRLKDWL